MIRYFPTGRILLLGVLLFQVLPKRAKADKWRFYCDLRDNPVVTLQLENGGYVRPGGTSDNTSNNEIGFVLSSNDTSNATSINGTFDYSIFASDVDDDDDDDIRPKTLEARYCQCWSPLTAEGKLGDEIFFCPVDVTHCAVPATFLGGQMRAPPVCFSPQRKSSVARRLWPSLVISMLALVLVMFCSNTGRNVFGCLISRTLFPCYNERIVSRMIDQRPDRANNLIMGHFRHRAVQEQLRNRERSWGMAHTRGGRRYIGFEPRPPEPRLNFSPQDRLLFLDAPVTTSDWRLRRLFQRDEEADAPARPHSLILKTRIFRSDEGLHGGAVDEPLKPSSANDDTPADDSFNDSMRNVNESMCSICYLDVEDGDRVGALPHCNHAFHVDCLKVWLVRRNVCPLCLDEDIATPQYADDNNNDDTRQNSTTASNADGEPTRNNIDHLNVAENTA